MPDDQSTTVLPPIIARQRSIAIKGLTARMPERGKIKIGGKGEERQKKGGGGTYQMPVKYDHFVVTTLQRGEDGNFIRDESLHDLLGDKPTEIPVRLIYDDLALDFPTRYACFKGRVLWCSGDGESAQRLKQDGKSYETVNCTCPRQDPAYVGQDKCKMNGNLSVLIEGAGGVGGVWSFRTTSYNSVVGLLSSMSFIRSVTGGVLANIPLKLTVRPKQATDPTGQQQTIYVVGLEFAGDMSELQKIGHDIALVRATTHLSITHIEDEARRMLALAPPMANAVLPGDDAEDIVAEFYPEQEVDTPPPPRREDFDPQTGEIVEEPAAIEANEPDGFDADEFELGFLSQLKGADTAEACGRLIQANLDDLRRLDGETSKRLIQKANGKAEELANKPAPAAAAAVAAPNPSLSVTAGQVAAAPAQAHAAAQAAAQVAPKADPEHPALSPEQWQSLGGGMVDALRDACNKRDLEEIIAGPKFQRFAEMKDAAPGVWKPVDDFLKSQRKKLPV